MIMKSSWKQLARKISFAEFLFILCFGIRCLGAILTVLVPVGWLQWSLGLRSYMFWDREIQIFFFSIALLFGSIAGLNTFRKKLGEENLNFVVEVLWMLTFGATIVGVVITIKFGGNWLSGLISGSPNSTIMICAKIVFLLVGVLLWFGGWFGLKQWNRKFPGWGALRVKKKKRAQRI
jgi:hypothetical protein